MSGIHPESADAPTTIKQAVARFYEGQEHGSDFGGNLKEWLPKKRREEAKGETNFNSNSLIILFESFNGKK